MSDHQPRVLVVVLNWNGLENTLECLEHLGRQTFRNYAAVVIDNGSTDGCLDKLRARVSPPCTLLALGKNRGFAGGMNVGLRQAMADGFDYAWLLNNDAFAEPGCLETLVRSMQEDPDVVITTPQLLTSDGLEQHTGGFIDWSDGELQFCPSADLCGRAGWGTWLTGTAMLIRLASLRQVGLFDKRFFAYWEDVDLCARIVKAGGDLRAIPEARCVHLAKASSGGETSAFALYMYVRNRWLFLRKHTRFWRKPGVFLRVVGNILDKAAQHYILGEERSASVMIGALTAILRGAHGPPRRLRTSSFLQHLFLSHPWRLRRMVQAILRRPEDKDLPEYAEQSVLPAT